jgi:hypothetical protein
MDIAFSLLVLVLLVLNWYASQRCFRDPLISSGQRAAQLAIVWLVPVLGALTVIALSRNTSERSTGKYRENPDPGDQYVTGLGRLNERGYIRSPDDNIHPMGSGHDSSD